MTLAKQRFVTRDVESALPELAPAELAPAEPAPARVADDAAGAAPPRRARAKGPPSPHRKVKILFVAANTRSGDQLALDEEYRAIEQSLRAARYRDAFQLIPQLASRRGDLQQALLEHSPDVVHFACHGSARAELLLLGDDQAAEAMSAEALASLFCVLQDNLRLVVFNACFASGQASAIRQHAGIAIGMRERIEDRVAIAFASALYGALAYGRSVGDAFDLGVAAVEAVDVRQKHVPQLFLGAGTDAHAARLVEPAGPRWLPWVAGPAALGMVLALASLWWRSPAEPLRDLAAERQSVEPGIPHDGELARATRPAVPGMVRFAAASVRPGALAAPQRPGVCAAAERADACGEPPVPGQVEAVELQAFDLDVMEVTNGDYARWLMKRAERWTVTSKGIVKTRGESGIPLVLAAEECGGGLAVIEGERVVARLDRASWPVACVTWHGANEYCRAQQKRLPLEAEWELAARGHGGRPFPWGAELPRRDGVAFDLGDGASAHPRDVGTSMQDVSPEGVRDLGGNVAEWVEDGRGLLGEKTLRGGSWASREPCHVLGSTCKRITLSTKGPYGPNVGFRCASSVLEAR